MNMEEKNHLVMSGVQIGDALYQEYGIAMINDQYIYFKDNKLVFRNKDRYTILGEDIYLFREYLMLRPAPCGVSEIQEIIESFKRIDVKYLKSEKLIDIQKYPTSSDDHTILLNVN